MKIKIQDMNAENFSPFGTFIDLRSGYGQSEVAFLPDRMLYHVGGTVGSFCSIRLQYRPLVLKPTEYHVYCEEVFGGFGCDVAFHVGLLDKNGQPDLESIRVFRLPAGCFARIKRSILHHAKYVLNKTDTAYGIVLLAPSAYTIDCVNLEFPQPIEIEL